MFSLYIIRCDELFSGDADDNMAQTCHSATFAPPWPYSDTPCFKAAAMIEDIFAILKLLHPYIRVATLLRCY